jgi:hypothetical protein
MRRMNRSAAASGSPADATATAPAVVPGQHVVDGEAGEGVAAVGVQRDDQTLTGGLLERA